MNDIKRLYELHNNKPFPKYLYEYHGEHASEHVMIMISSTEGLISKIVNEIELTNAETALLKSCVDKMTALLRNIKNEESFRYIDDMICIVNIFLSSEKIDG